MIVLDVLILYGARNNHAEWCSPDHKGQYGPYRLLVNGTLRKYGLVGLDVAWLEKVCH